MEGVTIIKAATFMDYNATHMVASVELLYSQAMPCEIVAHLVIRDVAGNEVLIDLDVAEEPEPTETPTPTPTEESSYFLFLPLLGAIALVTVVQIIRKRK
ncbi:MAG: hypothetical protein GOP50_11895 [Candidatus Heimdallarchaeota archaeon]|nr:hypothetical protein [Candidatus Heimdallarchaeota archaeon]